MPLEAQLGGVGYVCRKFPVLSETFILNEILALEALGMPVQIFSLLPPRDPRIHEGVVRLKASIHHVPGWEDRRILLRHARRAWDRNVPAFRRSLLEVVRSGRPTVLWRFLQAGWVADRAQRMKLEHLHAHFANRTTTVARFASRLTGIPYSFTAHAFDIYRGADLKVVARKMRDAAFTVTVSDYNAEFLRGLVPDGEARIELVRNGVDFARFAPPPAPPAEPFTILAVARLVEKKGLAVLVEACRHLRDRGRDFHCRIVGKGNQRGLLEALIREHRLRDRVAILPPHTQEEVVERFHEAHVVALPCVVGADGNRDGLPVSIVEALAAGVPVVSTPLTGVPEAVVDGVNGLLVPERDAVALADALDRLLTDRALLARMRAAARPSVAGAFDQELTSRELHRLFRETVRTVLPGFRPEARREAVR
jgi:glycosyltransferase involved in cell wall biosynthesis